MVGGLICIAGLVALIFALLFEPRSALCKRLLVGGAVLVIASGLLAGGLALAKDKTSPPASSAPDVTAAPVVSPTSWPAPTTSLPSPTPIPSNTAPSASPTTGVTLAPTEPVSTPTTVPTPKPTLSHAPVASPTHTPAPTPTAVPTPESLPVTEATVVYVSSSGILHLKPNCSGMKNYREMTLGAAETEGITRRCKNCFREKE